MAGYRRIVRSWLPATFHRLRLRRLAAGRPRSARRRAALIRCRSTYGRRSLPSSRVRRPCLRSFWPACPCGLLRHHDDTQEATQGEAVWGHLQESYVGRNLKCKQTNILAIL